MKELIAELVSLLKTGKSVAPEIAKEVLCWEFVVHSTWFVISCVLTMVGILLLYSALRYPVTDYGGWSGGTLAKALIGGLLIAFIFGAIRCVLECIKIKIAPKVYITEYCANLIKPSE